MVPRTNFTVIFHTILRTEQLNWTPETEKSPPQVAVRAKLSYAPGWTRTATYGLEVRVFRLCEALHSAQKPENPRFSYSFHSRASLRLTGQHVKWCEKICEKNRDCTRGR
jgi:hypothetical protein